MLPGWQYRSCLGSVSGAGGSGAGGSGAGGTPAIPTARIRLRDPGLQRGGCRVALLLTGTVRLLQHRVNLWRRVFCAVAGPWAGTCALQRAGDAISQLLAAKHQRDMIGWFQRWSAFTRCMSMHWPRMMPTTNSLWWLRGGDRPGAAHLVAGAAGTLI